MTSRERRWDELQDRWASGEALPPDAERERLELSAESDAARRELEVFDELRRRLAAPPEPLAPALLERVLATLHGRPRLRVVGEGEGPAVAGPRRRRSAWLAVAIAVTGAAAGGALWLSRAPREAPAEARARTPTTSLPARSELVLASGEVTVAGRPARVGARPLASGDRIGTGDGQACLTIDPGIDVCLSRSTEVVLESLDSARVRVRVDRGTALAQLAPRAPGAAFALEAGNVSAVAHGTVFAVQHAADGSGIDVVVVEGTVSVARPEGPRELVHAHSRVGVPHAGAAPRRSAVGRGEEARLLALAAPRKLWSTSQIGVLEIAAPAPDTLVAIDDEAPLALPLQAFVPAGRRRLTLRMSSGKEQVQWADVAPGETKKVVPEAAASPGAEPAPAPPALSAAALLGAARRELGLGNTRAALELYDRLRATYPASPEARTVLVTVGKLQLDLKQPARALNSFESYLRSGGPLAPEALAGKVLALRALGRSADERRAIETYLQRYPSGFDAPVFEKRLRALGQ